MIQARDPRVSLLCEDAALHDGAPEDHSYEENHAYRDTVVLREADGFSWLFPTGPSEILSLPFNAGLPALTSAYDLTGLLSAQVPAMAGRRERRNGFDYYRAVATGAANTPASTVGAAG